MLTVSEMVQDRNIVTVEYLLIVTYARPTQQCNFA